MLSWLRRRRKTAESIDAEADALIDELQQRRNRVAVEPGCLGGCSQDRQAHRTRYLSPIGDELPFSRLIANMPGIATLNLSARSMS
jgi:hypothetical protein